MYPIFASPMESVIDEINYKIFLDNKITPVIPRTVQQRLNIDERLMLSKETFVSFSLSEAANLLNESKFNTEDTFYICIDMAHGTLCGLYEICKKIKTLYKEHVIIMTGNVNNADAYLLYCDAGIDYMRLTIGSGSRCTTACAVGVFQGTATLIDDIVQEKLKWIENHPNENYTKIIVDGGIDWYDKIQKSIALGADGVMIGKLFAECEEACGFVGYSETEEEFSNGIYYTREDYEIYKKVSDEELVLFGGKRRFLQPFRMYRGMSHRSSQKLMGGDGNKVSEGICKAVKVKYNLSHWVNNMDAYLRSCMTYTNSKTISDLQNAEVVILGNNGKNAYAK
jgi:IMP dehydrogenase